MFEFIGFLLCTAFALLVTILAIVFSLYGGEELSRPTGWDWLGPLFLWVVALGIWYLLYLTSPFSIVVN